MPPTPLSARPAAPFIRALGVAFILGAVAIALLVSSGSARAASSNHATMQTTNTAADGNGGAAITGPTPGSTFTADQVDFVWSAAANVQQYWLEVSTYVGGYNIYGRSVPAFATDARVINIPTAGQTIYVRLWTQFTDLSWVYTDYTYTAYTMPNTSGVLTYPTPGSILTDSTISFQWNPGGNVNQYWFEVATYPGGYNIFGQSVGQAMGADVTGIPENGATIYVRLWTQYLDSTWQYHDYTYTARVPVDGSAELTTPADGSTLSSGFVTFEWTPGTNVREYRLQVGGANPGDTDYGDFDTSTAHSAEIGPIPVEGSPIYVRLWSRLDAGWTQRDYQLSQATLDPARRIIPYGWQFPTPIEWTAGTDVLEYKIDLGTSQGAHDLLSTSTGTTRSYTYDRMPTDGSYVWVRIWSRFASGWAVEDSRIETLNIIEADMTSPAGSTLAGGTATFSWSAGDFDPQQFRLDVGTAAGATDLYTYTGTSQTQTVSGLPTSGTIYVRLWTYWSGLGWVFHEYTYTGAP